MRFFSTAGPVRPDDHYAIAPLDRVDVDELLSLIRAKQYFVLHAPRQTGKTSALIALRDPLIRRRIVRCPAYGRIPGNAGVPPAGADRRLVREIMVFLHGRPARRRGPEVRHRRLLHGKAGGTPAFPRCGPSSAGGTPAFPGSHRAFGSGCAGLGLVDGGARVRRVNRRF